MDDKKTDVIFYGFIVFDVTFDMLCVRVWLFVDHLTMKNPSFMFRMCVIVIRT